MLQGAQEKHPSGKGEMACLSKMNEYHVAIVIDMPPDGSDSVFHVIAGWGRALQALTDALRKPH